MKQLVRPFILSLIYLFFALFLIFPLSFVLLQAFFPSGHFSLQTFSILFSTPGVPQMCFQSLNLALAVTLLASIIALPLAWLTTRYDFPAKSLVQGLLFLPMVLPPFVGAIGMRKVFSRFGTLNEVLLALGISNHPIDWLGNAGFWGVAITQALHLFPILYLNCSASLSNLDQSLEDAAYNFGASRWKVFTRIALPLLIPGYFAGASIVLVWAFTDLGTPLLFEFREVLPVYLFNLLDEIHGNPSGYALVSLMMAITACGFYFSQAAISKRHVRGGAKGSTRSSLKKPSFALTIVGFIGIFLILILALLPHLGVIGLSFSKRWYLTAFPSELTLSHYSEAVQHPLSMGSLVNSLYLSLASSLIDLVLGIMLAWFLIRDHSPHRFVISILAMLPLAIPGVVLAFGYVGSFAGTILDPRHNPIPLLILGYATRRLPFIVRSVSAGFQQADRSLEDAAQNVGASYASTLRRITLPLLFPHIAAGALLCFCFAMLEVSESIILAMEEKFYPLAKAMYALLARPDGVYIASALGVLSMLFIASCLLTARKLMGNKFGEIFRA